VSTTPPFQITAPAVMLLKPDSAGTFKITNSGTWPITVHGSLGRYNDHALHYPAASHATLTTMDHPWIQFSPVTFRLAPGRSQTVKISNHVPAGTHGNHYLNVVWTGAPANATLPGSMHLNGAVATSVEIPMAGAAVPVTTQPLPRAPAIPAAGFPALAILVPSLLIVLAVIAAVAWRHQHRRRTA
jgi:hypothetical protein